MATEEINNFYSRIGENVAAARQKKGISQLELAEGIGHTSTTVVSLAELNKGKHFNLEHLYKISRFLNVDICELIR